MAESETGDGTGPLNGAVLRVLGGILVGIGIGPIVVESLVLPIDWALGDEFATVFRPGLHLLFVVFGVLFLHSVRLFYQGTWRSLENDLPWQQRER